MKKFYLLLIMALLCVHPFKAEAQVIDDTWNLYIPGLEVPQLIFTEFRGDVNTRYYLELTNVGDTPIDLSNFGIISGYTYSRMMGATDSVALLRRGTYNFVPYLEGILQPGESYVEMSVWDAEVGTTGRPRHHIGLTQVADRFYHQHDTGVDSTGFLNRPEWQTFGRDSVSPPLSMIAQSGTICYYLQYRFTNSEGELDSTLIDNVNFSFDPYFMHGPNWGKGNYNFPVAGVTDPIRNNILVRKANITQGNMDWNLSRGSDAETSEWLILPKFDNQWDYYTTVGEHGVFSIDFKAKDPEKVIYDPVFRTITVPWDTDMGQTVNRLFEFGPGMAWDYYRPHGPNSIYSNVVNGDVFTLYAVGNALQTRPLTVQVADPTPQTAAVYSYRHYSSSIDYVTQEEIFNWYNRYGITQNQEIDSISGISYATPVDTLLKYLYKPEKADWEIQFVDGIERANLKRGDKLVVTSEDGSTVREYLIQVNEYAPSNNSTLSTISWPDYDPDVYWQWISDTIPGFAPTRTSYTIRLAEGTTNVPALQFKTTSRNATVHVDRAINLNGTPQQRTTTATVTSQSGLFTRVYTIIFELESTPIQPNIAEPFFSEMKLNHGFAYAMEIYNPGTEPLDLSRYMIAVGPADDNLNSVLNRFITTAAQFNPRASFVYNWHFVPGYRFPNDNTTFDEYTATRGYLIPDNVTNTMVEPGGTWVLGSSSDGSWPGGRFYPSRYQAPGISDAPYLDFCFYGYHEQIPGTNANAPENDQWNRNPWGIVPNRFRFPACYGANGMWALFLLRIENDSILDGTKPYTDPNDFVIVDRVQKHVDSPTTSVMIGGSVLGNNWRMQRLPHVWRGVTERGEGLGDDFGQSATNSEWFVYQQTNRPEGIPADAIWTNLGSHTVDPITAHLSTVTSNILKVTPGYEGDDLTITGDLAGLTVELFETMLDKSDPAITLEIIDGANIIPAEGMIAGGMILRVTSVDGRNRTLYKLIDSPLSGDNLLIAKDGSGISVSLLGPRGSVDGVPIDITIKGLLDMLEVPEKAILNVLDDAGNLVPLTATNFDGLSIDVKVSTIIHLEVIAENSSTAVYSLGFDLTSSDALLLSNILDIDQDLRLVKGVPVGINAYSMLSLVFANEGATITVVDKFGVPRDVSSLNYDDEIIVTSEDGSTVATYKMQFVGQKLIGNIMANVTFIINDPEQVFPEGFILKGSWNTQTGEYDSEWHNGAGHTIFYDDGTHGDETAGDNIWTVSLRLAVDQGENTWEWGFTTMEGRWLPSDTIQFKVEKAHDILTTYTIVTTNVPMIEAQQFSIYPNPVTSELFVDGIDLQSTKSVQIVNIVGQYHPVQISGSNKINVSYLEQGLYVLKIVDSNGHMSAVRFMKR